SLGPVEALRADPWRERVRVAGRGGILFWGALGLVVLGLLAVIAPLLPKPGPPPATSGAARRPSPPGVDGEGVVLPDAEARHAASAVQLEDDQLADGAEAVLRLDPERVLAGRDQLRRRQHRIGERGADRDQLAPEDEDLEVAPRIAVPAHVALPARVGRRRRRHGPP